MIHEDVVSRVEKLLEPILAREGLKLYGITWQLVGGRRGRLVVYLCHPDGFGPDYPVTVDDCARVSEALSLHLDVEDFIPYPYDLEVSSPGVDRSLWQWWHFESAVGQKVRVSIKKHWRDSHPESPLPAFLEGVLREARGQQLVIEGAHHQWQVPFPAVMKAQVMFEWGQKGAKHGKRSGKAD